jgi:uncharacterized protein YcaQ
MSASVSLSLREARRIAVAAQGLLGPRQKGGPAAVLVHLRAVQIDTISVLARSHELVAYSRLGAISRTDIEAAYWGGPPHNAFEYWAHAACVVPMEEWPNYEFRRQDIRDRGHRWHFMEDADKSPRRVLDRLTADGPLTANELGGAKKGGPWWDWSETKIAVEWLLDIGEVVCAKRRGFQRVYDLPERAVPAELLAAAPPADDQRRHLLSKAATALGVATAADLGVYCGLKAPMVARLLPDLGVVPVAVEGWGQLAWAAPSMLEAAAAARGRQVLVSPFDTLVRDRPRTERLFGFRHRLEAYTPRPKRVHGYYSMPVLARDRLVGRVDPSRDGKTLVARGVHLEPAASATTAGTADTCRAIARALWAAASWVAADDVRIEWVTPDIAVHAMGEALQAARP